jgi:hypothetical protein
MQIPKQVTHAIRLNAAWERKEICKDGLIGNAMRVTLPDQSPIAATTESVVYERKFNSPSGLAESDAVFLESALLDAAQIVTINGTSLVEQIAESVVVITPLLQRFNHLVIRIPALHSEVIRKSTARLLIGTA